MGDSTQGCEAGGWRGVSDPRVPGGGHRPARPGLVGDGARRGFLIDFSVALGFVGPSLMGLQFLLAARFRWVEAPFGMDVLLQCHRQVGCVSLLFILAPRPSCSWPMTSTSSSWR